MRFLCLHGLGTNSTIMESQFQPIRSQLPPNWKFEFLDGEVPTKPFLDIGQTYPGPYLCYFDGPNPEYVEAAVDLVLDVIVEDGPFDAVLGFSNGASLAVTVLAAAAERHPDRPPPFKSAIFFSCITPYRLGSGLLHLGLNMQATDDPVVSAYRDDLSDAENEMYNVWKDPEAEAIVLELDKRRRKERGHAHVVETEKTLSQDYLLAYYGPVHGHRIYIPTLHVHGEGDQSYGEQSRRVVDLCDPKPGRKVITHGGAHHFPKERAVIAKVVNAIEWVVERGKHHV